MFSAILKSLLESSTVPLETLWRSKPTEVKTLWADACLGQEPYRLDLK